MKFLIELFTSNFVLLLIICLAVILIGGLSQWLMGMVISP